MAAYPGQPSSQVSVDELVQLCAIDNGLFEKEFFAKTVRQQSAPFHPEWWQLLEDPQIRYLNLVAFRDSAKTSKLRVFTAKRVAYNLSKTILYVGASEAHAARSIRWLRARIEFKMGAGGVEKQDRFATIFGLRPGAKWTDTELEIFHGIDEQPIWILGAGMTGNIRGINFDDYRPDLIILDDVLTDENGSTAEQREKITDLVMGSLKGSLAAKSDSPNAKLCMLNTPQALGDVVHVAEQDQEFFSKRYSCWTAETERLDVSRQVSSWESRWPTADRRKEKVAALALQKGSIFAREKEVRVVSKETAVFREEWIRFYDEAPQGGQTVLFVDPTPPPKKTLDKKKVAVLDYEVVGALRRFGGNYFVLDYEAIQGTAPDWTIAKFFEMRFKYRPYKAAVETVAYQASLKWILEQEMKRRGQWTTVEPFGEIRSKSVRIQNMLHGLLSNGKLFVKRNMTMLIEQLTNYPNVEFDDVIDGLAIGVASLENAYLEDDEETNNKVVPLKLRRGAP